MIIKVLTEPDHIYSAKLILTRNLVQTHPAPLVSEDQTEHMGIYFLPNIYTLNATGVQAKTDVTLESEQRFQQTL